jgi:hypothetical protein
MGALKIVLARSQQSAVNAAQMTVHNKKRKISA